jgi:hypothetical protein
VILLVRFKKVNKYTVSRRASMIRRILKSGTLLLSFGLIILAASNLYAALELEFALDEPFGTITPTEDIFVTATLSNLSTSTDSLIFNSTGTRVNGLGPVGTAIINISPPPYRLGDHYMYSSEVNFYDQFAGLTLMPGESVNMLIGTYVAPPEGVSPGTYGHDEVLFYIGALQYSDNITRTVVPSVVPEPVSSGLFLIGGTLLAGLRLLIKRMRT